MSNSPKEMSWLTVITLAFLTCLMVYLGYQDQQQTCPPGQVKVKVQGFGKTACVDGTRLN